MQPQIRFSRDVQELLCCPLCRAKLKQTGEQFACMNAQCAATFPIVDGIAVLINERASVFSLDGILSQRKTMLGQGGEKKLKNAIRRLLPTIGKSIKGPSNYRRFAEVLLGDYKGVGSL